MGCFSSKLIARSISYHEERKQRSQRTVNGIPLLEDLIISTVSNQLHSRSIGSKSNNTSKLAIEPDSSEVIEKLEPSLSARQGQEGGEQFESDHKNRSKSWHCFPEHIVHSLDQENSSGFEDKHDLSSKGAVGSRSFHTVEEYDDMVDKTWLTKSQIVQNQSEFNNTEEGDGSLNNIPSSGIKNEEVVPIPSHKIRVLESVAQRVISTIEKGHKRKAVAKRLESLRIPSNVECPAIGSLREWLPEDGIYSPGSYVTPKFGSYSLMNANESSDSEDSIFSPELVSAFEQCMQKLEAEEENILKQIIENVEEESESDEGMQTQERTLVVPHHA